VAWGLGTALLAIYVVTLAWNAQDSAAAVAAFAAARSEVHGRAIDTAAADRPAAAAPAAPPGATRAAAPAAAPDQSLWSDNRIRHYEDALAAYSALPEAVLTIDSVQVQVPVFTGTRDSQLEVGAGRIEGTPGFGSDGNVGVAAHRDGFFRGLKDLEIGATIQVDTLDASYRYQVVDIFIVEPEDVYVLHPTAQPALTLVTCFPFYFAGHAPQRYIVRAHRLAS
jgi:sortase A